MALNPTASAQASVKVTGGADQGQMGKSLRKVAEELAGEADLLTVQTEVVRVGQHLLEGKARFVESARFGQRLDIPEGAHRESALFAGQAGGGCIAFVVFRQAGAKRLVGDGMEVGKPVPVCPRSMPSRTSWS